MFMFSKGHTSYNKNNGFICGFVLLICIANYKYVTEFMED